jgi:hypothetical protein
MKDRSVSVVELGTLRYAVSTAKLTGSQQRDVVTYSQGRSLVFTGSPGQLFAAESRKALSKAANSGKSFAGRRELSSSERTEPRSSCHSTRHESSVCSSERKSHWQSATRSDSRKTSKPRAEVPEQRTPHFGHIDEGKIIFDKGELVRDGAALHLDQGIAVTSHASQAKTVDQVIASVPVLEFSQANEAQFYVSMSRARWAMHVFTDSKVALRDAVTRPIKRLSS